MGVREERTPFKPLAVKWHKSSVAAHKENIGTGPVHKMDQRIEQKESASPPAPKARKGMKARTQAPIAAMPAATNKYKGLPRLGSDNTSLYVSMILTGPDGCGTQLGHFDC
ncbi:MAG: hypothetical protein C4582_05300 [Desulfobacteraceae bacterium]|nr:MAG: hypothetical protein C4582_05300 [Desulfobacteraceae bacterium]